jgi:hypothetical protein
VAEDVYRLVDIRCEAHVENVSDNRIDPNRCMVFGKEVTRNAALCAEHFAVLEATGRVTLVRGYVLVREAPRG